MDNGRNVKAARRMGRWLHSKHPETTPVKEVQAKQVEGVLEGPTPPSVGTIHGNSTHREGSDIAVVMDDGSHGAVAP